MTWYYKNIELFAPASMIIVIGIVLCFIFMRFVHSSLFKAASRSSWAGDDAVLEAVEPGRGLGSHPQGLDAAGPDANLV